jgi:hypothetical protein
MKAWHNRLEYVTGRLMKLLDDVSEHKLDSKLERDPTLFTLYHVFLSTLVL